ncbi:MAG: hypothetical protein KGZ63_11135 [Clostridiales bacterium]|nr:hypothetical protein [Clostridiales bacterium]
MSKLELLDALRGKRTKAVPWFPYTGVHCAYLIGEKADDYLKDPDLIAKGVLFTAERYKADGMPLVFDLAVEASALGCALEWHADNPPSVSGHPLAEQSLAEAGLTVPTARDGRWPVVVEAGQKIMQNKGDWALVGLFCGPLTLAAHLRGTKLFTDLVKNKELAAEIISFSGRVIAESARIYRDIGCEVLGIVDPVASQIHPDTFREFVAPHCQEAIDVIHSAERTSIFLTCGDASKVMEDICKLGVHSFSCDEQVNLNYARDLALHYGLGFSGSLKLTMSLMLGMVDPREDAITSLSAGGSTGYVLAPGCNVPYNVPPENIDKVLDAMAWHQKYYPHYPDFKGFTKTGSDCSVL